MTTENKEERKARLQETIRQNRVTAAEIEDALNHHLEQLQAAGCTCEDDVCCVLRKMLAYTIADDELYMI